MLYLNEHALEQCFDFDLIRKEMINALADFSSGKGVSFQRSVFNLANKHHNQIGFMPAASYENALLGYKSIAVFPNNNQAQLNPHQGMVVLLSPETGQVNAILNACFVTAIRTAAVSAAATDLLARRNAHILSVIGAGRQAFEHILAIVKIRSITHVNIYCRDFNAFNRLAAKLKDQPFVINFAHDPQSAVRNADIVVTCTAAKQSLLGIDDIPLGAHVNAIGACRPGEHEFSLKSRRHLKIFFDSEESCLLESDEILQPLNRKILEKKFIIGELGLCFVADKTGRVSNDDITVFKSVGIGITDLYAAECLYQQAKLKQIGQRIEP